VSIEANIQVLKNLAALDAELAELEGRLGKEREGISGKRTLLDELERKLRLSSESIQEYDRARSQLLGELRQMSAQVDRAREKLARCRNEREANAAQRELEELRKLYRDREHEMEKLVGAADELKSDVATTTQRRDEIAAELGASEGSASQKIGELEGAAQELQTRRAELGKRLDQVLFRRYELIRKKKGSGLAEAANGGCAACHIKLPPMMFQQISQGGPLQQCPSCHRILYFEQAPPQSREQRTGDPDADSDVPVDQAG
jgi:predicted  nucleic acid-binding Zn-ribbon protein